MHLFNVLDIFHSPCVQVCRRGLRDGPAAPRNHLQGHPQHVPEAGSLLPEEPRKDDIRR